MREACAFALHGLVLPMRGATSENSAVTQFDANALVGGALCARLRALGRSELY